jgi:uncharacterized protein (DUF1778 family)
VKDSGDEARDGYIEIALENSVRCPYSGAVRTQRLELRLTDDERQLDSAAATAVGETLSDFFRRAASARAQDVLADQQRVALNYEEAARFLDALDAVDQDTVARLRELRERA